MFGFCKTEVVFGNSWVLLTQLKIRRAHSHNIVWMIFERAHSVNKTEFLESWVINFWKLLELVLSFEFVNSMTISVIFQHNWAPRSECCPISLNFTPPNGHKSLFYATIFFSFFRSSLSSKKAPKPTAKDPPIPVLHTHLKEKFGVEGNLHLTCSSVVVC